MKRFFLWVFGFTLMVSGASAQSVSPEVLGSAGTHASTTNAQVSWTIGETITETYQSTNNDLTQGFHQTTITISALEEVVPDFALEVFPNPAQEQINVRWTGEPLDMELNLMDMHGRTVRSLDLKQVNLGEIDVTEISQGTYFLTVGINQKTLKNYKIVVAR